MCLTRGVLIITVTSSMMIPLRILSQGFVGFVVFSVKDVYEDCRSKAQAAVLSKQC